MLTSLSPTLSIHYSSQKGLDNLYVRAFHCSVQPPNDDPCQDEIQSLCQSCEGRPDCSALPPTSLPHCSSYHSCRTLRYTLSALLFLSDARSGPLHSRKLCAHNIPYQGICKAYVLSLHSVFFLILLTKETLLV